MKRAHHYTREKCSNKVRAKIIDPYGRTITLMGRHAFEYQIAIESNGNITITTFCNRTEARKRFNQLKKI